MIILKSAEEIAAMRRAGRVVAEAHALVRELVKPGITTWDLDQAVEEFLLKQNAVPAFKGYQGYPASICASVNEVVVHGIPSREVVLEEGSIVSIDIGAFVDGFCGDSAWTYPVGEVAPEIQRLLTVAEEALFLGIDQAQVGNRLSDISHAVQSHVEAHGFSVVRDFVGHGIGRQMHEAPQIPNFGPPGRGPRLKPGMTLAIEPMVNVGGYQVEVLADNWTVVTRDKCWSAHFEHTVAVTDGGPVVLTVL
ncbi:MAG: type I methionyl aminopeptidase [Limnochordia bacterium]|nr:type I methionyl aminopeptidase [Limnochordia bacterium]MDI9466001.1 type I methionyl aminopeptidase [Bacillota bacterium]NLO95601.1 type I methionyl aminopeptidase [Bacillota bacterium]HAI52031.1 type I methionyl aminopeptidase [Bacillota bacterium]HAN95882.1 type I methionyl aminopeptidase [Bacillota bacterium]